MIALHNILNTKEKKNLFSNFLSLSVLQLLGYIFPLITTPYLAHVIGVTGFGAIAFASSIIAYFQTLTDWGFKYTAVRDIAKNKNNILVVSHIFTTVMVVKLFLAFLSACILLVLIKYIPFFSEHRQLLWISFMMIPGYILFPDWLFQAMEKMKYITILNFLSRLFFVVCIFIFIKEESDYILEPFLMSMGYIVSGLIGYIYAFTKFHLHFVKVSFSDCYTTVKKSSSVFLTQFFPTLYNNLSIILLQRFSGIHANGIFNSGYKFITLADQFSSVISRTFFPFLSRRMDKHKSYVKITFSISILMSFALFVFSDIIIDVFYTSEFQEASRVIRIMSLSPFFLFLMNSYGTNGLLLINKEKLLRNIVISTSIIGFILAFVFIYFWSYIGVAVTLTITWGIRGLITFIYAKKYGL